VPWTIDNDDKSEEGSSRTLAKWTALKTRLMPYLYAQAAKAIEQGIPLSLRAMCLEFPEDPTSWYLDRQFMVGDNILAAPIFDESGEVEFYLPKGKWTCFFTNKTRDGPGWFKEKHGFGSLPLYVRENSVLVLGKPGIRGIVYDYASDVEVALYHAKEGASTDLSDKDGKPLGSLTINAEGDITGSEILKGNWKTSKHGRDVDESHSKTIQWF
jgi:alpha-D-xyloside xylohydrolase